MIWPGTKSRGARPLARQPRARRRRRCRERSPGSYHYRFRLRSVTLSRAVRPGWLLPSWLTPCRPGR